MRIPVICVAVVVASWSTGVVGGTPTLERVSTDTRYRPVVGDVADLALELKTGAFSSARCLVSFEDYLADLEMDLPEELPKDTIDPTIDYFCPKAGTPVRIVEIRTAQYQYKGMQRMMPCYQVEIQSGAFTGQKGWVSRWHLHKLTRKSGSSTPVEPRQSPGDKTIELTDIAMSKSVLDTLDVSGRFRNTSGAELAKVRATIYFEDSRHKLVTTRLAYCNPERIPAGETGGFMASVLPNDQIKYLKVSFEVDGKSVAWTDSSGENVHQ